MLFGFSVALLFCNLKCLNTGSGGIGATTATDKHKCAETPWNGSQVSSSRTGNAITVIGIVSNYVSTVRPFIMLILFITFINKLNNSVAIFDYIYKRICQSVLIITELHD